MNNTKLLTTLAAGLLLCGHLAAQETEFDLSSQRSESQDVLAVPGQRVDHRGIVINPTPHHLTADRSRTLDLTQGLRIKDLRGRFADDLGFLTPSKKGPVLEIDFGARQAAKCGVEPRSGAYALQVGKQGIRITGYDERGAFYGIQTLRQLIESPAAAGGKLPFVTVTDYPDLPLRGVVEGFYGTPWSHEVRLSLIDFYGRNKMNCYLYGPKDDPYHSCPNWRLPYPEQEARQIRELVEACNRNRVDFVWAIHPGQDIKWNEEDYNNLVRKFEMMYDLGVRSFAIFFDDISGEGTNPVKQTELLNRLNEEFVRAKGDVAPLTVCPTDYSRLWANPTPQGSLSIYGKTLDPSVNVFWTGDVVCSDMTRETMEWVNSRIRRPAFYWWNFPGDGLRPPHRHAGSRIRARHDAHGQGGLRRGEQPDGARRGLEAGPLRRGRLHVEYRRIQRNRQLGARHRGPHARGGRRIPHLCHPLLRHGDRIPPRRVVGDPHLPHRGVHAGGVRRTAARVPRHRAGAGTDGGRMPQRGAARGIAPVGSRSSESSEPADGRHSN